MRLRPSCPPRPVRRIVSVLLLLLAAPLLAGSASAETVTTGYTWHPTLPLPTQVVEDGLTTDLTYDDAGRLLTLTQTDTTSQSVPFPTGGRQRTWTYAYGIGNRLAAVDGPLPGPADTTRFTYTRDGNLQSVTDPAGLVTTATAWNGRGQPTAVTDPNGVVTTYAYDGLGRLTAMARDAGPREERWSLTYTPAGDVATLTAPAGRTLTFTWDGARRLVAITNNLGERTDLTRDALGGITRRTRTAADGTVTFDETRVFDELGRLIRQVGSDGQLWRFAYDRADRLGAVTDPRGHTIGYGYDGVGRLVTEVARDGGLLGHGYDGKSQETHYTDPGSLTTTYVRNGFGEVIEEVSPDRGTSVFDHDERGLLIRQVDGRGIETTFAYDAAGRLVARHEADPAQDVLFTYDDAPDGSFGRGRLTGMQDAAGASAYAYDAKGRLARETRTTGGVTAVTAYGYDRAGRLSTLTYPSGRVLHYAYDAVGRVQAVSLQRSADGPEEPLVAEVAYRPDGPLQRAVFGNGLTLAKSFDRDGRLVALSVTAPDGTAVLSRAYAYEDGLNLTRIDRAEAGGPDTLGLSYDPAGRLAGAMRGQESWGWTYDLTGNRTSERHADGPGTMNRSYGYAARTNRLVSVTADGVTERSLTVDAAGALAREDRGGTVYGYGYDAGGHLAQVSLGSRVPRVRATYLYDGRERLAVRNLVNGVPTGTTHLVYDAWDHVLAETDASGTSTRDYVWLGDLPVAVLDGTLDPASPVVLFVAADHLDRPAVLTDRDGNEVWRAAYDPFGAVAVAAVSGPASLELGLPGQWFQLETGQSYNWHRHYDPSKGRYIQPDPLGLHELPQPPAFGSAVTSPVAALLESLTESAAEASLGAPDTGTRVQRDGASLYAYAHSDPLQNTGGSDVRRSSSRRRRPYMMKKSLKDIFRFLFSTAISMAALAPVPSGS